AYVDQPRVKQLKDELEMTKKFEGMQDRLYKVAQRLHDLNLLAERLKEAEAGVNAIKSELARSPWTPEQMKELSAKATRVKEDLDKVKLEPDISRLAVEIPLLETEKAKLEEQVQTMGFSRPIGEIEGDLKHAMGISANLKSAAVPEAEVPKMFLDRAAELIN